MRPQRWSGIMTAGILKDLCHERSSDASALLLSFSMTCHKQVITRTAGNGGDTLGVSFQASASIVSMKPLSAARASSSQRRGHVQGMGLWANIVLQTRTTAASGDISNKNTPKQKSRLSGCVSVAADIWDSARGAVGVCSALLLALH